MQNKKRPQLSVIIASVNGLSYIKQCLRALERQDGQVEAEVIVADCCQDVTSEHIKKKFPQVKLLKFSERLSIPELRSIGMSQASGGIITITEDHCIARKDWYLQILKAHESDYAVVGGAVENGSTDRIIDWAVFLCEYSKTMPPLPEGETESVAGNNVSYKSRVLENLDESLKKNYWEFFLHEVLKKKGIKFFSAPAVVIEHKKNFGFWYFLNQRFHYSRSFAGMRIVGMPLSRRIAYIIFSPFLLFLQILRIGQQAIGKKRHLKEFLLSLPLLMIFMVSYTLGEVTGYLSGPGDSLIKVE